MKKEEILEETLKTIAYATRTNILNFFQLNLKGENALLLQLISSAGQSTPGALAECLGVSAARIAAMLRSLELKKLIERVCDEKDKRRITVIITENGRQFVDSVSETIVKRAQTLLEKLGEEDAKEFLRLLKKCTGFDENLEETNVENESLQEQNENEKENINQDNTGFTGPEIPNGETETRGDSSETGI